MRATKGYLAGLGTTSALVAAIACAFTILSAVVAVQGWTGALSAPPVSTVDGGGAAGFGDPFAGLWTAGSDDGMRIDGSQRAHHRPAGGGGGAAGARGVLVWAEEPRGGIAPATVGQGRAAADSHGTAADATRQAPSGSPAPVQPAPEDGGTPVPARPSLPSGGSSIGSTVTEVTSSVGSTVTQTGQQLGGAVQGTTGQLGDAVGQVSPAAGQLVTQTGQTAGGVVSGATGAVGQVVQGTGAAAGGVLGGLVPSS